MNFYKDSEIEGTIKKYILNEEKLNEMEIKTIGKYMIEWGNIMGVKTKLLKDVNNRNDLEEIKKKLIQEDIDPF